MVIIKFDKKKFYIICFRIMQKKTKKGKKMSNVSNIRDKHSIYIQSVMDKVNASKTLPMSDEEKDVALIIAKNIITNQMTSEYDVHDLKALVRELFFEWRGNREVGVDLYYTPGVQRAITGLSQPKITISLNFGFGAKTQAQYDKILKKKEKGSQLMHLAEA